MREVGSQIRPSVRSGRDRHDVLAVEVDVVGEGGGGEGAGRSRHVHVARNEKAIEFEVHRKGVAVDGQPVAGRHVHAAVGFEKKAIEIELDAVGVQAYKRASVCRRGE